MSNSAPKYFDYNNVNLGGIPNLDEYLNLTSQNNPTGNKRNPWLKIRNSAEYIIFVRLLLKRAMSVYEIKLPDEWNKPYFMYELFCSGHIGVFKHEKYGVICQGSTLAGYGLYYQPTEQLFVNPLWVEGIRTAIDFEHDNLPVSAMIQLMPDYTGLLPICEMYAAKIAIAMSSLDINILNSRLAYVAGTNSKSGADSFYKAFDDIYSGKPMLVLDKSMFKDDGNVAWEYAFQNLKQNYIAPDIINSIRCIMNDFDSIVGLPNANTEKKERQIVDEVNANNQETEAIADIIIASVKHGIESAKRLFNVDITFNKKEFYKNELSNTLPKYQSNAN